MLGQLRVTRRVASGQCGDQRALYKPDSNTNGYCQCHGNSDSDSQRHSYTYSYRYTYSHGNRNSYANTKSDRHTYATAYPKTTD